MLIALDTNVFIYHLESHRQFGPLAKQIFTLIEVGQNKAMASAISLSEIITLPALNKDSTLAKRYYELLTNFPNLSFINIDDELAYEASLIRGRFTKLKLMDAFILASAARAKVKKLITEDKRLLKLNFDIEIISMREFLG